MILNYEHGKLDIFMNGKLKYSSNGINIKNKILQFNPYLKLSYNLLCGRIVVFIKNNNKKFYLKN